ncbi:MAG TPA: hypothetical protein VIU45_05930 [Chitinophagaceae bacterium]
MKSIKIIIERGKDQYAAYAENVDGIYGAGDTPDEAKQSVEKSIKLFKKYNAPENIPAILKGEYEITYRFDTISLLNYYKKVFTNSAMERLTGINQRQIQHYASGLKKPRAAQVKKIEKALHNLGEELLAVEL